MPNNLLSDEALWKRRFRAKRIFWTELARSEPTRGLVAANKTGVCQLFGWNVRTGELKQLTDFPGGTLYGTISPDGRHVYYLDDKQGNETGHLVAVPFEGGHTLDLTPDTPPYSSNFWRANQAGMVGLTAANSEGFHLFCIDKAVNDLPGTLRLIYRTKKLAYGPHLSHGGEIALIALTERADKPEFSLVAFDAATGVRIREAWDGPGTSVEPFTFSPLSGDLRVLATTNRTGVRRPLIWNPRTNERVDLALVELDGEVLPCDWSLDGERLLLCQFKRAVQQLYMYELATQTLKQLRHPSGTFGSFSTGGAYFAPLGKIFADWEDSNHPGQLIELDSESGQLKRTVLAADTIPPGHPWKSVTLTSSNGQLIQGWLGLPVGEGPFPAILHVHGGPESVMTEIFHPESQAWLDEGFAFLTINYRGSTTFGKKFQEEIWGNPGRWEIEDIVAARGWLIERGIAKPEQILVTGWSYGGYLTLLALGRRPELWAGGMAGVAIADWKLLYEDEAETLRGYQLSLFGGAPVDRPEQYAASSPITYAEKVTAPVLIIQGRNDTRCPSRQMEAYEEKMRLLGKPIEVHWFETGHMTNVAAGDEGIRNQETKLRFAKRILGL
jgi:dienelactone hydrolase